MIHSAGYSEAIKWQLWRHLCDVIEFEKRKTCMSSSQLFKKIELAKDKVLLPTCSLRLWRAHCKRGPGGLGLEHEVFRQSHRLASPGPGQVEKDQAERVDVRTWTCMNLTGKLRDISHVTVIIREEFRCRGAWSLHHVGGFSLRKRISGYKYRTTRANHRALQGLVK